MKTSANAILARLSFRDEHVPQLTTTHNVFVFILSSILLGLTSCGGGGENSGADGIGWVTIQSNAINVSSGQPARASLSGEAFVSTSFVIHQCSGLACIFGSFSNSYPGVDVVWTNLTTGGQGAATSRYGTATNWDHMWSANVPVVAGTNQLKVTATDSAGNFATADISVNFIPPAPSDLRADTGDGENTLLWGLVPEATGYRLYWASTPGDAFSLGTPIDVTISPYVHAGLTNGLTYYYVVTSLYKTSESAPSAELTVTPGAPSRPENPTATQSGNDVQIDWDVAASADSYTLYWGNAPGVSKQSGTPIPDAIKPYLHTGLSGLPYYYVVTAVNGYGESLESDEVVAWPPLVPPAPEGLAAAQRLSVVDLTWQPVAGISTIGADYVLYRCQAWAYSTLGACAPAQQGCYGVWESIGRTLDTQFVDTTVNQYAYWYYVTTSNQYGPSLPSDWAGLCVVP